MGLFPGGQLILASSVCHGIAQLICSSVYYEGSGHVLKLFMDKPFECLHLE